MVSRTAKIQNKERYKTPIHQNDVAKILKIAVITVFISSPLIR